MLVLDAGDFSRGNALVDYFKGENAVDFLNITKYDAIALGNHEFDFGLDTLKNNLSKANFKVLGANVCDKKTGKVIFDSNAIFEFDNMKVGVFGLTTPSTFTASNPINVADMDFLDDEELMNCVQDQIYSLKKAGYTVNYVNTVHLVPWKFITNSDCSDYIFKMLDVNTSIDILKPILHIPILLLHECDLTRSVTRFSEEYKQAIKDAHLKDAQVYFKKQIGALKDEISLYSAIHFHLVLFPVPNKESIVDGFYKRVEPFRG